MLSIPQCKNAKEVKLLARTIAEHLEQNGFTENDLLATATVIIDQAIKLIKKKPDEGSVSKAS